MGCGVSTGGKPPRLLELVGCSRCAVGIDLGDDYLIRGVLCDLYGREVAEATTIQYGGSMNDKNAAELLKKPDVDGGLIGGASLVAEKFRAIVEAAQ